MQEQTLQDIIQSEFTDAKIAVSGDGHHFDLRIISDVFVGLSSVKRQQMVYKVVQAEILSGRLHALNIHPLTVAEWQAQNG